jgi:hypothetical protein
MPCEPDLGLVEGKGPLFPGKKDHLIFDETNIGPGPGRSARRGASPPRLDRSARRAPPRRAGPTFVSKKRHHIAAFEPNIRPLSPPRPLTLCGGPLPVLQLRVPPCLLSDREAGLSPCPLTRWDDAFPTEDRRHPAHDLWPEASRDTCLLECLTRRRPCISPVCKPTAP